MKNYFYSILMSVCALPFAVQPVLQAQDSTPGKERYYYQKEWGTRKFQLLREQDGALLIKASEMGQYRFRDDGTSIGRFAYVDAQFKGIDGLDIRPYVIDENRVIWTAKSPAVDGMNRWFPQDFEKSRGDGSDGPSSMAQMGWDVRANKTGDAYLINCVLKAEGGESIALFGDTKKLPSWVRLEPSGGESKVTPNATTARVFIAQDGDALVKPDNVQKWIEFGQKHFPGKFGVDMAGGLHFPAMKTGIHDYNQAGVYTLIETHFANWSQKAWARNNQLYAVRYDGFTPDSPLWSVKDLSRQSLYDNHSIDTTHPMVLDMMKDRVSTARELGFDSILIIDYVWPYAGGRWGYGEIAIAQWKRYLKGEGFDIALVSPNEEWSFSKYWSVFSSIPLLPESFGWSNWDEFSCGLEAKARLNDVEARRLLLFNALWHFHYLAFLDQLGRHADGVGIELSISVNPEDVNNGSDFTLLSRLKYLDSLAIEFFGNPLQTAAWKHTLAPLRYRDGGSYIDMIGEINAGGHGPSRYGPDLAYAFYYDAASSCDLRFYNNQYVEGEWALGRSMLSESQVERFGQWFAGATAFLLRRQEEGRVQFVRPEATVVVSRSVLEYQNSSSHSLLQEGSVSTYLSALNVDFEQVGRDAWNVERDSHTRILFFCPASATPSQLTGVKEWIDSGSDRVLVLHGGSAWTSDRNVEAPATDAFVWKPNVSYRESIAVDDLRGRILDETLFSLPVPPHPKEIKHNDQVLNSRYWESPKGSTVILSDESGTPLLSYWKVGENYVYHINIELPAKQLAPVGLTVVDRLIDLVGLSSYALLMPNWELNRHPVAGGHVVVSWNRSMVEGRSVSPEHKGRRYNREKLPESETMRLVGASQRLYRIYSVFEDREWDVASKADGTIEIELSYSPDIIYYGEPSDEFMETIAEAKSAALKR